MGPPFSDKSYPVSYTNSLEAVGGEGQKPVTMSEFATTEVMYKHPSAVSKTYSTEAPSPHPNILGNMTTQKATTATATPLSSTLPCVAMVPSQATIKGQEVWPSPPLAAGDVDSNYCTQESSTLCNSLPTQYHYLPASSHSGWCPVVPTMDQSLERYGPQGLPKNIQDLSSACTLGPAVDLGLDSTDGFLLALNCENEDPSSQFWEAEIVPSVDTFETSPASQSDSVVESPASMDTPRDVTAIHRHLESRSVPSSTSPPSDTNDSGETEKSDEPYAKLIYKAIMTRPDYSMTLQEIYQWFRDNTTKAVTETGGWQNSIRHNLSMNAAFRKRDKVVAKTPKHPSSTAEESKRVNEWVLEDWAIRDGVQSTTRYRKNNYAKRAGSVGRGGQGWVGVEHSVKRALSGRKGGCATRAARMRRRVSYGQMMMPLPHHPRQMLEYQPDLPTYSSPADIYGISPVLPNHYNTMPYYASLETYPEGMVAACAAGESTSEPLHVRLGDTNLQHIIANSNNLHHGHHTVHCDEPIGQGHRTPAMDVNIAFDLSELPRRPGAEYQDAKAYVSTSPTCRPFQPLPESPYVWWNQHTL